MTRQLLVNRDGDGNDGDQRIEPILDILRDAGAIFSDPRVRQEAGPLWDELQSVIQMVAVEVLEIRGSRAMRSIFNVGGAVTAAR